MLGWWELSRNVMVFILLGLVTLFSPRWIEEVIHYLVRT